MSRFRSEPPDHSRDTRASADEPRAGLPALRRPQLPSHEVLLNSGPPSEAGPNLGRYVQVLQRRWLLVVSVFVVVCAAVAAGSLMSTPVYRAEGTIEIRKQAAEVVPVDALFQEERISDQYLQTQYAMLRSPTLIRRLLSNPDLASRLSSPAAETAASDPQPGSFSEEKVQGIRNHLTVDPLVGSRIVRVRYESEDPQLAADFVNAVIAEYLEMRDEVAAAVQGRLAEQADSVRADLLQDEHTLQDFVRANGLALLVGQAGEREAVPQERLRRLQQELTDAEAATYMAASTNGLGTSVLESDLLKTLRVRISEVQGEYARLRPTFTDSFPRVQQLRSELARLDSMVAEEYQRVTTARSSQQQATQKRRQLLQAAVNEQRMLIDGLAGKMAEYQRLQRDLDGQKELYALLQQKLKEASVSASLASMDVAILDPASRPTGPVRPLPKRDVPLGAMIGLMVGIGLAFLRDYADRSVRSVEEFEEFSRTPVIGMIPTVPALLRSRTVPDSALTEAFGGLRTSLLFNRAGPTPRTLLVTSVQPGDGKTTISTNLALSLASLGWKVLLVDADLRRPCVHRALGFDAGIGLAEYLTAGAAARDWRAFLRRDVVPSLDVMPAGSTGINPADLLSTEAYGRLMAEASATYDFVIVDAPALFLNAPDARILATSVDGVVLVVRSGNTPRDLMRRVLGQTPNIVGVVLNDIDPKKLPAYYGEYGSKPEQRANGTSDVRSATVRPSPVQL